MSPSVYQSNLNPQKSASGPRRNFRDSDFGVAEVQCPIGNCLRMRSIGPQKHGSNRASSPRKKAKATVAVDRRGFSSYREPLHSWNHSHLNRLSRGLVDMHRCAIGFKFRDEVRIHVSKGLEAVPTEQLVIPWGDSHHREDGPISALDHTAIDLACPRA